MSKGCERCAKGEGREGDQQHGGIDGCYVTRNGRNERWLWEQERDYGRRLLIKIYYNFCLNPIF